VPLGNTKKPQENKTHALTDVSPVVPGANHNFDWQEQDYVFTGLKGGPLNPRYMLKLFDRLLKEAELPHMPFHNLRHSAATLLLSMGVNPKVVQEILGHSNISMTMDTYSHVLPSIHKEAMDKWDDAFGMS